MILVFFILKFVLLLFGLLLLFNYFYGVGEGILNLFVVILEVYFSVLLIVLSNLICLNNCVID